jgi:hypothetical protein
MGSVLWLRETARLRLPETLHEDTPERKVVTRHVPLGVVSISWPVLICEIELKRQYLTAGCCHSSLVSSPSTLTPLQYFQRNLLGIFQYSWPYGKLVQRCSLEIPS